MKYDKILNGYELMIKVELCMIINEVICELICESVLLSKLVVFLFCFSKQAKEIYC